MRTTDAMNDEQRKAAWAEITDLHEAVEEFLSNSEFVGDDPYYSDLSDALWSMLEQARNHSTTARAEARKAALEEAAALADQWSEARLDEANAPIISGDVFTDGGVFVQSTADANAGYRLMDLATAIRALIEHESKEG